MNLDDARDMLAGYGRRLISDGLSVGTSGNLSIRVDDRVAITPSGVPYDEIDADDIVVVEMDGRVFEGRHQPSSELPIHLGLYTVKSAARAVVHTHSRFAVAVSTVLDELPAVHYMVSAFGGPVRVVPYSVYGSDALAEGTLEALQGRNAALLQNHGAVTYGGSMVSAYERALLLEWLSEVFTHAQQLGQPRILTTEEVEEVVASARRRKAAAAEQ